MIAIDAMGGDFAPHEIVQGALKASSQGIPVILFGDTLKIGIALSLSDRSWHRLPISIRHCAEVIGMAEDPIRAVNLKGDASMVQAAIAVAKGEAHAVVSAGNSGAALVTGMLHMGKLPGVTRAAIGGFLPTQSDSVLCLDLGANIECKPEHLLQFALMGDAYVRAAKGISKVRLGLLANGSEEGKGTRTVQQAYELLKMRFEHFVGNCEPSDVLNDKADVIVSDGFAGNIMLKSMEAAMHMCSKLFHQEGNKTLLSRCASLMSIPVVRKLKNHMKRAQRGGALLLGVNKPFVIAHGASQAETLYDAICFAHEVVQGSLYNTFSTFLAENFTRVLQENIGATKKKVEVE
jgi:glycerol-3-phosphate acyltransferase PlsX